MECFASLHVKQSAGWLPFFRSLILITVPWDGCYYFCYGCAYIRGKDKKCRELPNDCKATESSSLALSAPSPFSSPHLLLIPIVFPGVGKHRCPAVFAEWMTEGIRSGISWLLPCLTALVPCVAMSLCVLETLYRFYQESLFLDAPPPGVYPFLLPPLFLLFYPLFICFSFPESRHKVWALPLF